MQRPAQEPGDALRLRWETEKYLPVSHFFAELELKSDDPGKARCDTATRQPIGGRPTPLRRSRRYETELLASAQHYGRICPARL